jgi:succinate dehydrogenase/fumarate reductase-like Fe-S protein
MKIKFKIWRQANPNKKGEFKQYAMEDLHEDMSLLEALDHLNEELVEKK